MPSPAGADISAQLIDPRGPRFAAAVTAVLLAAALALGPVLGWPVLLGQTLAFAAGSLFGLRYQPWAWVFRVAVRPRLAPPAALEDARPPRFAQTVGLLFGLAGLLGAAAAPALFYVAGGFALVAAVLNAVFDYCLGCEIYLLGRRVFTHAATGTAR
ncbi:MAG: DUF4395 domain-containing protein [Micropruina sp.]|uniref:DUF4395 domain-containing protein n=1 Tax=Micropruina sp. TaxID=2737536 RepID=UPI0039E47B45